MALGLLTGAIVPIRRELQRGTAQSLASCFCLFTSVMSCHSRGKGSPILRIKVVPEGPGHVVGTSLHHFLCCLPKQTIPMISSDSGIIPRKRDARVKDLHHGGHFLIVSQGVDRRMKQNTLYGVLGRFAVQGSKALTIPRK